MSSRIRTMAAMRVGAYADRLNGPAYLSRSTPSPPYPPGGMMSEFEHGPVDGRTYWVTIFFRYASDEETLVVVRIGRF